MPSWAARPAPMLVMAYFSLPLGLSPDLWCSGLSVRLKLRGWSSRDSARSPVAVNSPPAGTWPTPTTSRSPSGDTFWNFMGFPSVAVLAVERERDEATTPLLGLGRVMRLGHRVVRD